MPAPDLTPLSLPPVERPIHVHLHARFVSPETLAGGVVVVIDNLRASVTITAALARGATLVVPTLTVEDAIRHRDRAIAEGKPLPLLGGERGGVLIPGFDLDNSPRAYTKERVEGREVVFTTANGTAALLQSRLAARVIVGSFVNLSRVVLALHDDPRPVHLLCCGSRDDVGLDDILPAGAMVERLVSLGRSLTHDDSARLALLSWHACKNDLDAAMESSRGGRGLARLGLADDIRACAAIDSLPVLPVYSGGVVRVAND